MVCLIFYHLNVYLNKNCVKCNDRWKTIVYKINNNIFQYLIHKCIVFFTYFQQDKIIGLQIQYI